MSIASQHCAANDLSQALVDMTDSNPVVRAIASRKAEEAFQRIVKARTETFEAPQSLDFRGEVPALQSALIAAE